jgi:hypothetical protein
VVWLARARAINRTLIRILRVRGESLSLTVSPAFQLTLLDSRVFNARVQQAVAPLLMRHSSPRARSLQPGGTPDPPMQLRHVERHTRIGLRTALLVERRMRQARTRAHARLTTLLVRTAPPTGIDPGGRLLQRRYREDGQVAPASRIQPLRRPPIMSIAERAARTRGETERMDTPAARAPATLPPVNVEHLTEQVMHQIDRRIVAWRERMGRA